MWGEAVTARFQAERSALEAMALARRPDLTTLANRLRSPDAGLKREQVGAKQFQFEQDLESAALEVFFEHRFVRLALAGRVPVNVDSTYGAIHAGDLLVASPTAGHAMSDDDPRPGSVIGKVLESVSGGRGQS